MESCTEVQDFGEGHSFSGKGLIADSGRRRGGAAGYGVSPFLELAPPEGSPLVNWPWVKVAYCCSLNDAQK